MFVTRATRHDKDDLTELLDTRDWGTTMNLDEGTAFIARDGELVGCVRLIEVEPQTLVVDSVLVRDGRRREGIGTRVMQTAMNSRGGTLYLCCHDDAIAFYERLGFALIELDDAPESVRAYWEKVGDIPTDPDHVHYFMRAR